MVREKMEHFKILLANRDTFKEYHQMSFNVQRSTRCG